MVKTILYFSSVEHLGNAEHFGHILNMHLSFFFFSPVMVPPGFLVQPIRSTKLAFHEGQGVGTILVAVALMGSRIVAIAAVRI